MHSSDSSSQKYWAQVVNWRHYPVFSSVWGACLKVKFQNDLDFDNSHIDFRLFKNPELDIETKLAALEEIYDAQPAENWLVRGLFRGEDTKDISALIQHVLKKGESDKSYVLSIFASKLLDVTSGLLRRDDLLEDVPFILKGLDLAKLLHWMNAQKIDAFFLRAAIYNEMAINEIQGAFNALPNPAEQAQMLLCLSNTKHSEFLATLEQKQYESIVDELIGFWHEHSEEFCTKKMNIFADVFSFEHAKSLYFFQKLSWAECPKTSKFGAVPWLTTNRYITDVFYNAWETHIEKIPEEQKFKLISGVIYNKFYRESSSHEVVQQSIKELTTITAYLQKEGLLVKYIEQLQQDIYDANNIYVQLDAQLVWYVLVSSLTCEQASYVFDPRKAKDASRHMFFCQAFFYESIPLARSKNVVESGLPFPRHFLFSNNTELAKFLIFGYKLALLSYCSVDDLVEYYQDNNFALIIERMQRYVTFFATQQDEDGKEFGTEFAYTINMHLRFLAQIVRSKTLLPLLLQQGEFLRSMVENLFCQKDAVLNPFPRAFYREFLSSKNPGKAVETLTHLRSVNKDFTTASSIPIVTSTEVSEGIADPRHAFIFCIFQSFYEVESKSKKNSEFEKFVDHILNDQELFISYFKSKYFKADHPDFKNRYLKIVLQKCSVPQAILIMENCNDTEMGDAMFLLQESRGRVFISNLLEAMSPELRDRTIKELARDAFDSWKMNEVIAVLASAKKHKIELPKDTLSSICTRVEQDKLNKYQFMFHTFLGGKTYEEVVKIFAQSSRDVTDRWVFASEFPYQKVISCNFDFYLPILDFIESYPKRWKPMLVCKSWCNYYNAGEVPTHEVLPADILKIIFDFVSPRALCIGSHTFLVDNSVVFKNFEHIRSLVPKTEEDRTILIKYINTIKGRMWQIVFYSDLESPADDYSMNNEKGDAMLCKLICRKYISAIERQVAKTSSQSELKPEMYFQ